MTRACSKCRQDRVYPRKPHSLSEPPLGRTPQDPLAMQHSSIHWFWKGLWLHNNSALLAAATECRCLHPLFILDPSSSRTGPSAQCDLDGRSLQELGSRGFVPTQLPGKLLVGRSCTEEVFLRLFCAWGMTWLTFEVDTGPAGVMLLWPSWWHGTEVIEGVSHTLYNTKRVLALNDGKAALNDGKASLTYKRLQNLLASHNANYGVPTLKELGQDPTEVGPHLYPSGEMAALAWLDTLMERTTWVCSFKKPETEPTWLSPSTTVLSPYLKFGCRSVRTFWWWLEEVYQRQEHSQPPVSLHGQLLWREFFYTISISSFDQMVGNPIYLQVDWENNPQHLHAWREGRTDYPFIDAIMTQLCTEGWIHHLAQHTIACFLTRGDLWVSWEEGLKVFEELLDADWSLNASNWPLLSGSAFFHWYFHVCSPVTFCKKMDRDGAYIRKYLRILKDVPAEYVYEPWRAPRAVQEQAGCLVGTHYPQPLLEHGVARKRNLGPMKAAHAGKERQLCCCHHPKNSTSHPSTCPEGGRVSPTQQPPNCTPEANPTPQTKVPKEQHSTASTPALAVTTSVLQLRYHQVTPTGKPVAYSIARAEH
ncbi:cryptochrome-2-like [Rhynochetos jubatus]